MPRLPATDPRTGRDDVPATDVNAFIEQSREGAEPGSPSFRAWNGRKLPSGKMCTRTYWEKLSDIAEAWGFLRRGTQGERAYIVDDDLPRANTI